MGNTILKRAVIVAASAVVCAVALAQTEDRSAAQRRFVSHPTHCAQLFGGPGYGDTVSSEWSNDLAASLDGAPAQAPAQIAALRVACAKELQTRAESNPRWREAAK